MIIDFAKFTAFGNDFICIDNRNGRYTPLITSDNFPLFLRGISRRQLSIGADGVIFAESAKVTDSDIGAHFFEPDGSEVELCGNGVACFTLWVTQSGYVKHDKISIFTKAGITHGSIDQMSGNVTVCIPDPYDIREKIKLKLSNKYWEMDYAVVGVPHVVVYTKNLSRLNVDYWGRLIRNHPEFGERGVNVNFVEIIEEGHIAIRTFEFGVEGETLSCGTGSSTAALLVAKRYGWKKQLLGAEPVLVDVVSKNQIKINFIFNNITNAFADVCMQTIPSLVYKGIYKI